MTKCLSDPETFAAVSTLSLNEGLRKCIAECAYKLISAGRCLNSRGIFIKSEEEREFYLHLSP